jgi:hypothetical protein
MTQGRCLCGALSYEIESADRAGGIIKAARLTPDPAEQSTHDGAMYDFMSFILVESKNPQKRSLHASVESYTRQADGKKRLRDPSRAANVDARDFIRECNLEGVTGVLPLNLHKL